MGTQARVAGGVYGMPIDKCQSRRKAIEALEGVSLPDVIPLNSLTVEIVLRGWRFCRFRQVVDRVVSCRSFVTGCARLHGPRRFAGSQVPSSADDERQSNGQATQRQHQFKWNRLMRLRVSEHSIQISRCRMKTACIATTLMTVNDGQARHGGIHEGTGPGQSRCVQHAVPVKTDTPDPVVSNFRDTFTMRRDSLLRRDV